jgi:tyrosyl-tRNA synthetase
MKKIITDEKLVDKFLNRGVEAVYPSKEELKKKLMSGERLRIYQGFDPTGPYLHVGHAMGIRGLRILQQLGHEVIFLVGDFTSRVGDPDKDTTRKFLTVEEIEKNMSGWKEQAAQLIDFSGENPVLFKHNYDWLAKLKLEDIIDLMSHITVQRMLERDMFERRYKGNDPIYLQEFIYPLMQGYDGVAMKVDIEIGGADQTFNMLVGRSLSKSYLNKEKFVRTNKMMDAPDGRTMSKTKGNGINLGDSAEDMYGKAMSYPDSGIAMGLELLTEVPMQKIKEIEIEIKKGTNPMEFKKLMAYEIVKEIKGKDSAKKAQDYFIKTVQKKEMPSEIESIKVKGERINIIDLLVEIKFANSKSEAKRLIEQGGIKIDGKVADDIKMEVETKKEGMLIQRGKRQYARVLGK